MAVSAPLELGYLFGVHFADGSEYFQTGADVSTADHKRSAFYDLCQHAENGDLLCDGNGTAIVRDDIEIFQLESQSGEVPHTYTVDLRDGHFEIDGAPFYIQIPPPDSQLSLVYFRRRRHHFQGGCEVGQECEYFMGWRYTNVPDHPAVTLIVI